MQNNTITKITRNYTYRALALWDRVFGNINPVVILAYHALEESGRFSTKISDFHEQMKIILKTHKPVSLRALREKILKKQKFDYPVFVVTFDDGYKSVMKSVSLCQKYAIMPTLTLIGNPQSAQNIKQVQQFLSKDNISKLVKLGWEVGSHTSTHQILTSFSGKALKRELVNPKKYKYISFPLGRYDELVVEEARNAGYKVGLTMDDGIVGGKSDLMKLPRVGVDATHELKDFHTLFSPSVVRVRYFLKNSLIKSFFINI